MGVRDSAGYKAPGDNALMPGTVYRLLSTVRNYSLAQCPENDFWVYIGASPNTQINK